MDRQTFILISDRVRHNAMQAVLTAPSDYVVRISPRTRSLDQNAFFHALCDDIAQAGLEWAGKARDADAWKVLLVSGHTKATEGEVEIVPGLENEFVNIRESTARMSVSRATSLIEYTLAFCAEKGVPLIQTRKGGFLSDHQLPGGSGNAAAGHQTTGTNRRAAAQPIARRA
jgi:hypothetical protein